MRKVKIVCTMGPAVAGVAKLAALIESGMDVARLNFSHGDHASHAAMYADIREASRRAGKPVAILADLCGPKIRLAKLPQGPIDILPGQLLRLVHEAEATGVEELPHTYPSLCRDVKPGDRILIDDGLIELRVVNIEGPVATAEATTAGRIQDRKGINLPSAKLSTPALTEKDKRDLLFAKSLGVDYFALSFVRRAEDLRQAKDLAGEIPVIAKIEKPEALEELEAVLDASDGAMIARGDLGVEAGHEKVPLIQKRIIELMSHRVKPVIIATQMLDSMIRNPTPTRAEVSDVANGVIDGTDAVMLSGETSVGAYPIKTVETMAAIIDEVERSGYMKRRLSEPAFAERSFSRITADAAVTAADDHGLKAIAVYTESGRSAALVSAYRPKANVAAFSRHERVLQKLALLWGVKPLYGGWVQGVKGVVEQAERELKLHGLAAPGDEAVITFGMVLDNEPFQTNVLKLWRVR